MQVLYSYKDCTIYKIDPQLVDTYAKEICESLDQIPLVAQHTKEQLLATKKADKSLHHKFDHSLIALSKGRYVGVILGYEREAEGNSQYPRNSIYLSDLAVSSDFQKEGLGKFLVKSWLEYNKKVGFLKLDGRLSFSVQTNSAEWNKHVQGLYTAFGFKKIAEKKYDNRVDFVYFL